MTYSGGCLMGELTLSRSRLSPLETEVLEWCAFGGSQCYGSVVLIYKHVMMAALVGNHID